MSLHRHRPIRRFLIFSKPEALTSLSRRLGMICRQVRSRDVSRKSLIGLMWLLYLANVADSQSIDVRLSLLYCPLAVNSHRCPWFVCWRSLKSSNDTLSARIPRLIQATPLGLNRGEPWSVVGACLQFGRPAAVAAFLTPKMTASQPGKVVLVNLDMCSLEARALCAWHLEMDYRMRFEFLMVDLPPLVARTK